MLKKVLLLLSGTLILVASSLCYINFSPQHTSTSKTYQYKKKPSTYQFQKLSDDTNTTTLPAAGSWKDDFPGVDNSKILGIAGQFNIFTRNLNSKSDLNGNFASENLNIQGWLNVGTTGISYIKNALTSNHDGLSFKSNTLILGEYLKYTKNILWGRPGIGNFSLSTAPSNFKQDVDGKKYIDFDSEFERLSNNSNRIANASTAVPISYSYDAGTIDVSNAKSQNNVKYVTVNFSDIHENAKLDVAGNTDNAKIVITIDTTGINSFSTGWISLQNDTTKTNILFNFFNVKSQTDFSGDIQWNVTNGATNAILGPRASVTVNSSAFNGNIVAQTVNNNNKSFQQSDSHYPDATVPSDSSTSTPKLISAPNVNFGSHKLNSATSLIGSWDGDFKVSGEKGQEIKINVSLAQNFKYANGKDTGVTWQLVKSDYSSGTLETSSQDISTTPASITYNDDGTGDLIASWNHNRENKQYIFYDIQISKLNSVTEAGDYTATLKWELADSP
ncbi:hypothetical protein WZ78_07360 [Leuconostoc mesenteroides subsp. dextranicum]|uniref:collagen-binding domain-containing protein n=1 Tax=Leuconostoc mesenteroides TaxID=1245 RepID=UPI0006828FC1|nr:collagen-binding domain-containing protein [Leuconostoc mesenteroides]KMY81126.1 hypothetical protein WZ78_07360 [Leuconostoc mesenteroides subsp. dextranicum]